MAHPELRRDGVNFESKKPAVKDESMTTPLDLSEYSSTQKTSAGNAKKINNPLVRKDCKTRRKADVRGYAYDMCGHTSASVDRYLELSGKSRSSLKPVSTPCLDDHQLMPEDDVNRGLLKEASAKIVLKCFYVARMNRTDL